MRRGLKKLFDVNARLLPKLVAPAPERNWRMDINPHAKGGLLLRDLHMPDFRDHAATVPSPGALHGQDTMVLDKFLADVVQLDHGWRNQGVPTGCDKPMALAAFSLAIAVEICFQNCRSTARRNERAPGDRMATHAVNFCSQCAGRPTNSTLIEGVATTGRSRPEKDDMSTEPIHHAPSRNE